MSAAYAELVARAGVREEVLDRLADVERGLIGVDELRAELVDAAGLERRVAEELRTGARARAIGRAYMRELQAQDDRGRGHPPAR